VVTAKGQPAGCPPSSARSSRRRCHAGRPQAGPQTAAAPTAPPAPTGPACYKVTSRTISWTGSDQAEEAAGSWSTWQRQREAAAAGAHPLAPGLASSASICPINQLSPSCLRSGALAVSSLLGSGRKVRGKRATRCRKAALSAPLALIVNSDIARSLSDKQGQVLMFWCSGSQVGMFVSTSDNRTWVRGLNQVSDGGNDDSRAAAACAEGAGAHPSSSLRQRGHLPAQHCLFRPVCIFLH
jgi:hypothetical protein